MTSSWQTELADFFATIKREDEALHQNGLRRAAFYANAVGPALEAAAAALRSHGRECETGTDNDRLYLIVRLPGGEVEFQYAVLAEVSIETVVPYAHCWFEEPNAPTTQETDAASQKADDAKDEDSAEEPEEDGAENKQDDKKDDKKPQRTKTIEPLAGWNATRSLESITPDEVLADFLAYYREAVTRLRAYLHAQPAQGS